MYKWGNVYALLPKQQVIEIKDRLWIINDAQLIFPFFIIGFSIVVYPVILLCYNTNSPTIVYILRQCDSF